MKTKVSGRNWIKKGQGMPIRAVSLITLGIVVMILVYVSFETTYTGLIDNFLSRVDLGLVN